MKLADLKPLPAGTRLLNKTTPVTLIGLTSNSRATPRGRATTYARVTTPAGGETLVLPRLLTRDPYPTITDDRGDLAGHTVTVERVDRETARAWIPVVRGTWQDLIGRRAVVERHDGRLSKVCAIEGVEHATDVERIAECTARTYGARYVPAAS